MAQTPHSALRPGEVGAKPTLQWVYDRLLAAFGPQHWWPGESAFEVCVGAILTQAVSWRNVEIVIKSLKVAQLLRVEAIAGLDIEALAQYLRPARYYRQKARCLHAFCSHVMRDHGGQVEAFLARPTHVVREELLRTRGIGPETADAILLYAGNHPVFVVDAYTRRLLVRLGLGDPNITYDEMQNLFVASVAKNVSIYNEYHALIVRLGKDVCGARKLRCGMCPLQARCPIGLRNANRV